LLATYAIERWAVDPRPGLLRLAALLAVVDSDFSLDNVRLPGERMEDEAMRQAALLLQVKVAERGQRDAMVEVAKRVGEEMNRKSVATRDFSHYILRLAMTLSANSAGEFLVALYAAVTDSDTGVERNVLSAICDVLRRRLSPLGQPSIWEGAGLPQGLSAELTAE
jgi:hypothetical protein